MYELRQLEPRSIAQIHPADPLSLTAALQGVHPVSLDFVADPAELAVAVVQGEVLVEAAQHHREVLLLLAFLPMSVSKQPLDAMRLYEQAIRSAGANGFIHNEALANEIASRFYAARGSATSGQLKSRHWPSRSDEPRFRRR